MSYAVYRQLSGPTGIDHAVKVCTRCADLESNP